MTEDILNQFKDAINEPVAIIGMACRFPGAENVEQYWENLCAGRASIHHYTQDEVDHLGLDLEAMRAANFVPAKPKLTSADCFDASFFGYSHREAELMDPQQRIFHECVWEALENAGYAGNLRQQSIGIFAGQGFNSYLAYHIVPQGLFHQPAETFQAWIANQTDFLTNRIAYKLDLNGPACTVQTACSTTLVAAHMACQSLANLECDIAVAGGVNLMALDLPGYFYQEHGFYSPDGQCRVFDADAQGSVFGDGQGVVILKLLEQAIEDRDTIYAVIRGTATNNDGARKASFLAPGVHGLKNAVAEAIANAGITADTISYVESHGLGTETGDPLEVSALTQAFQETTDEKQFCALGSLKPNIGHPIAAAGAAGLIKVSLAMKQGVLPPTIHFQTPNPNIPFAQGPFYVNDSLTPWKAQDTPRRAGINAYGIGGTNAHIILEEAPALPETQTTRQDAPYLFVLSARTASALEQQQKDLAAFLSQHPEQRLGDVAFTLAVGRKAFEERWTVVCQNVDALIAALESPQPLQPELNASVDTLIQACQKTNANTSELEKSLTALGQHWVQGTEVDWLTLFQNSEYSRIPLPSYPFNRQRYRIASQLISPQNDANSQGNTYARPELKTEYVAPDTETAEKVTAIWQTVLGVDKVGLNDDFFALGGDSLLASRILSELPKVFEDNLPLESLLACRTVQEMVNILSPNASETPVSNPLDEKLIRLMQSLSPEEQERMLKKVEDR